jgi:caa(3)-type oxidase subunit IV
MTQASNHPGPRAYTLALLALLLLLAATIGANELPFPRAALAIALLIASVKAGLVVYTFMELRDSAASTRTTAAICVFTAATLFGLSAVDWTERDRRLESPRVPISSRARLAGPPPIQIDHAP